MITINSKKYFKLKSNIYKIHSFEAKNCQNILLNVSNIQKFLPKLPHGIRLKV